MKHQNLIFAGLALTALLAACNKEETPTTPQEEPKSTECKLTSFTVTSGIVSIDGFIDPTAKTVEISYMPNEFEALKSATAEVKISDKATISPDPTVATDYTVEGGVQYTVTAEDGVTTSVYTVSVAAAEFKESANKIWSKTYGDLGLAATNTNQCGVAFCDLEHFATSDFGVYDLDGNRVGELNVTGIGLKENQQFRGMTNDDNGVLVALSIHDETEGEATVVRTRFWAWLDGYSAAPTLIYGPTDGGNEPGYMSVSGDVKGDFVLSFRTNAGAPQMHHVLVFKGGKYFNGDETAATWYGPMIQHPGNDGCWGQMLSFFSGNPEDGFVCWDSATPAELGGDGPNASSAFYVYNEGLSAFVTGTATELALKGGVTWTNWDADGRWFNYGNYSTGHVRAFVYNGQKYIVACSASWPNSWITIQKADNVAVDDPDTEDVDESESNFLLPTDIIEATPSTYPCSAYVYDPATGTGHVICLAQSAVAVRYDLVTETL